MSTPLMCTPLFNVHALNVHTLNVHAVHIQLWRSLLHCCLRTLLSQRRVVRVWCG